MKLTPVSPDVLASLKRSLPTATAGRPAFFVFSIAKSGSTMLNKAMEIICKSAGVADTNFPGLFFEMGIPPSSWQNLDLADFFQDGYGHRGFRYLPNCLVTHPLLQSRKSVLLVRDVRDAATSHYFSKKFAHKVPGQGSGEFAEKFRAQRRELTDTSIDEHVLKFAPKYTHHWKKYEQHLPINQGLTRVFRYEDIVFSKKKFLADVCEFLEIDAGVDLIDTAVNSVDVFPNTENVRSRIRVVTPGDYHAKLSSETINTLNQKCKNYLSNFGYLDE